MNESAQTNRTSSVPPTASPNLALAGWVQKIVPFGIFTTDLELRITSWNDWLVTHSGLRAEDVIGKALPIVFESLETGRNRERYDRALTGEVSVLSAALHKFLLPFPPTVSDADVPHMLQTSRVAPIRENEAIVGTLTVIEDVTQREAQAARLHRQQEFDRLLSASLAKLLQSIDPTEEMAGIFAAIRFATGLDCYASYLLTADERHLRLQSSVGLTPKQREAVENFTLSAADLTRMRSNGDPESLSISAHRELFHALGVSSQGSFPLVVGNRVLGLVLFGSYQTDPLTSIDTKTLSRVADYVAIALDRARREQETIAASRAKDDFLAALSHELRTPLNPVLLIASDAGANRTFPEEAREAFRVIEKNALLEARLIDDLLDLTRITHGKMAIESRTLDAHLSLRDAVTIVQPDVAEKGLSLELSLAPEPALIVGDSGRLQQVIWNVLKNAVKFTPAGGRISVRTEIDAAHEWITLSVADTGIGMDEQELAQIFEAFTQGDHAASGRSHQFGGLGLGLAISRKLVEMHAGQIHAVSSGKGKGSSFIIRLPLVAAPTATHPGLPLNGSVPVEPIPETAQPSACPRILLVEDHEPTRLTLTRLLVRRGFEVVPVENSVAALEIAASTPFGLVLSDIGLPDGDGYALMRKLRDLHGLRGIALTGYGMEEDHVKSAQSGFIAHLTKPISVSVLDQALERVLGRHR